MDEIYEVDRDEYAGLIGELKKDLFELEKNYLDGTTVIKLISRKTGALITKRVVHDTGEEEYYIYTLPDDDERLAAKKIRRYNLESQEEVQAFFDILNKVQNHDRIIS